MISLCLSDETLKAVGSFYLVLMDPLTGAVLLVTNERALLSGSDQPVRKLGRLRILYVRQENKRSKTATFAQWYGALLISATDTN